MAVTIKRNLLGVEIGAGAVRALLIQTRRGQVRVVAANQVPLDPAAGDGQGLADALKPILAHAEAAGCTCLLSLPAGDFIFRHLTAPFNEERKLRQVLPFELEPGLSLPVDGLVFDYRRIDDGPQPHILAAALAKERLAALLQQLAPLGIEPDTVTVNGMSAALWLAHRSRAPSCFLVAALAPGGATVFLMADGRLQAVRDVVAEIASDRGRQLFIAVLHQTLRATSAPDGGPFRPEKIILTGYDPATVALETLMAEGFQLPVERADLGMMTGAVSGPEAADGWVPGAMNGPLALCLTGRGTEAGFNLRQGEFAVTKFWSRHRRHLQRTGVLAALVMVLAAAHLAYGIQLKRDKAARIDRQITALFRAADPQATQVVDPVSQMRAKINALEAATRIPGSETARPRAIDILAALSRDIPAALEVELTKLVIGTENLVIAGDTDTFNAVDEIKTRLEKDPMFKEVIIAAANIDKRSGRVRFTLNIGRLEVVPWPSR